MEEKDEKELAVLRQKIKNIRDVCRLSCHPNIGTLNSDINMEYIKKNRTKEDVLHLIISICGEMEESDHFGCDEVLPTIILDDVSNMNCEQMKKAVDWHKQSILKEKQLEFMRQFYPGFKEKEATARRVLLEQKKYREVPGYIPNKDEEKKDE